MKSPTELDMGFKAKTHFSFLLGRGTVMCGRPLTTLISLIVFKEEFVAGELDPEHCLIWQSEGRWLLCNPVR